MAIKILRIGMTYPRDNEPGIGQHSRYHSLYSDYDELILTTKREGNLVANRPGVRVVEIDAKNTKLGVYGDGKVKRIVAAIRKIKGQLDFIKLSKPYIDDFKPDLVHVYTPIPIGGAIYAKKKYGAKIIMSLHGSDALRLSKVPFLAKILIIPDAIVTVSENMIDILPPVKLKRPIINIGNGVDLDIFKPMNRKREKQFIHVANLRWQKGQEYLLEGFGLFCKNHPDYVLKIIGDGEEKNRLLTMCKELDILDKVYFLGTCSRDFIANELNKSQAFVLTSVSEGFPKVIIEAMATGTPVISSDSGNVKQVVGDSGIIFPVKDGKAVARAMEDIISDSECWNKMSAQSKEIATHYGWESHVKKLNAVYEEVLGVDYKN